MSEIRRADGLTARVNQRDEVVWCNSWAGLLRLALEGHDGIQLDERGTVTWRDRPDLGAGPPSPKGPNAPG